MVRDVRYIIKRIIIGVGIAICMYFFRNYLFLNCYALEVNATPQQILVATPDVYSFSPYAHTWGGQTVFSFPPNTSTDWGSGASVYFTYPQNSGATYCNYADNLATMSGRVYNASTADIGRTVVQYEDTTVGGYHRCSYEQHGNYIDFICNNFPSNHGFNIQLGNAGGGMWGIVQQINFTCIQSGENISASINSNNNENTQRIINNENMNTDRIIDSNYNNMKTIDDTLKSDNTTEANTKGSNFFNNFQTNSHGLSGIITAPIRLINSLTTATCNPLEFDLPIIHNHVVLPCMRPIIENYFGVFFTLYQLITTGLISYNVCINLYSKVRALQNPNNDRIEVLNL